MFTIKSVLHSISITIAINLFLFNSTKSPFFWLNSYWSTQLKSFSIKQNIHEENQFSVQTASFTLAASGSGCISAHPQK
jgi:hypothetical protein